MFKDELGGKIMKEFCVNRAKTDLMYDGSEHKKNKGTKKCIIKHRIMHKNYTDCLFNNKTILRSQQRFKSEHHEVYTEEVNKIALSSNDDKRLQTFDRITIYPHGKMYLKCVRAKWWWWETFLLKTMKIVCFIIKS